MNGSKSQNTIHRTRRKGMGKIGAVYTVFLLAICLLAGSCAANKTNKRHMTERLFLEKKRITLSHTGGGGTTAADRAAMLNERIESTSVGMTEATKQETAESTRLDTNRVYSLSQVTVTSRARFASVHEGRVTLDFIIRIPKEFLSDDFQLCLTPEILGKDSTVRLEDVVLRGKNFIERQEQDYKRYNNYLSGIIDPSGYDTAFVDRSGVDRELNRRRKDELDRYYRRWNDLKEYGEWRTREQAKYDEYNIRMVTKLRNKLAEHGHKYEVELNRWLYTGKDTAALGEKYRAERKKIIASGATRKQITLASVPAKYREFYLEGINPEDLEPVLPDNGDSLRLASEYRRHDRIAVNEAKDFRKEEIFRHLVPSPYRPDAHFAATIVPGRDFAYRYTQDYSVPAGVKSLRLTVGGRITATDRSVYNVRRTDTLAFVISSTDELADGSLLATKGFTETQREEYALALRLLRQREYVQALNILNGYKDYNTAVALVCLGHDRSAYELLKQLPKNANVHYLSALTCCGLGEIQAAIKHLKEACKLDPTKLGRAGRDSRVSKLIADYRLEQELEELTMNL